MYILQIINCIASFMKNDVPPIPKQEYIIISKHCSLTSTLSVCLARDISNIHQDTSYIELTFYYEYQKFCVSICTNIFNGNDNTYDAMPITLMVQRLFIIPCCIVTYLHGKTNFCIMILRVCIRLYEKRKLQILLSLSTDFL